MVHLIRNVILHNVKILKKYIYEKENYENLWRKSDLQVQIFQILHTHKKIEKKKTHGKVTLSDP